MLVDKVNEQMILKTVRYISYFILLFCTSLVCGKKLELGVLFTDNLVLQQRATNTIWGEATKGDKITLEWSGEKYTTTVDKTKRWSLSFPVCDASFESKKITISSSNGEKIELKNVLVGEVWLASGQSNMELRLNVAKGGVEAAEESEDEFYRIFTVFREFYNENYSMPEEWLSVNSDNSKSFSAVAYFFGKKLRDNLKVPVGIINCSLGGTVTESWTSPEVLSQGFPAWERFFEKQSPQWKESHLIKNSPSACYQNMLEKTIPYAVKGVIWYQGEGNAGRHEEQKILFPSMMNDWRAKWKNSSMPIYFVQLARYERANWVQFRLAQQEIANNLLPHSALAVSIDLSREPTNHPIHPAEKKPIGDRLAYLALAKTYGYNIPHASPTVKEARLQNNKLILSFDYSYKGLKTNDGKELRGIYLSDDESNFYQPLAASIAGKQITLTYGEDKQPVAVRYAFENDMGVENLDVNLVNSEGLPSSPFILRIK